jgi:hypothetical protein
MSEYACREDLDMAAAKCAQLADDLAVLSSEVARGVLSPQGVAQAICDTINDLESVRFLVRDSGILHIHCQKATEEGEVVIKKVGDLGRILTNAVVYIGARAYLRVSACDRFCWATRHDGMIDSGELFDRMVAAVTMGTPITIVAPPDVAPAALD